MVCRVDVTSTKHTIFIIELTLNSITELITEIKTLSKRYKWCQCWEQYINTPALLPGKHYNTVRLLAGL
jgi:hypothetical protein